MAEKKHFVHQNFNDNQLKGVVIEQLPVDPLSPPDGKIWYNTTDNKFKGVEDGVIKELVGSGGGGSLELYQVRMRDSITSITVTSSLVSLDYTATPQFTTSHVSANAAGNVWTLNTAGKYRFTSNITHVGVSGAASFAAFWQQNSGSWTNIQESTAYSTSNANVGSFYATQERNFVFEATAGLEVRYQAIVINSGLSTNIRAEVCLLGIEYLGA